MILSPVILFVYNRPWHTRQTVECLQKCELAADSELYIFSDGPKEDALDETKQKIADVRQYIHTIDGFKSIHIQESPTNKGLANSVIQGVSEVIKNHERVIVVEDDIVTHPFFLRFMNEALNFYANDHRIYSIGGFNYNFHIPQSYKNDVYIVHRAESWGWATWKDRWDSVDWDISDAEKFFLSSYRQKIFNRGGADMSNMLRAQLNGEIDSWAIRWDYHLYKHNAYCLRPTKTLVRNIGFDGSGVHCGTMEASDYCASEYQDKTYSIRLIHYIRPNKKIEQYFHDYLGNTTSVSMYKKLKRKTKKIIRLVFSSPNTIKQKAIKDKTTWYGGEDYGGFSIDDRNLGAASIVYSFGIGEDISFDKDLMNKFGCPIFAFDPTPRAKQYVEKEKPGKDFHFEAIGIANHDGNEIWHMPRNKDFVSCSIFNHENYTNEELAENTLEVKVQRLKSIMAQQGHSHIDLCKMDVEGSEFDVIDDILKSKIDIRQITLEFHPQMISDGNKKVNHSIRKMKRTGYRVIFYDPTENCCTFIKE